MNDTRRRIWTGRFPDGSRILVERYTDELGVEVTEVATRGRHDRVWSPPLVLEEET